MGSAFWIFVGVVSVCGIISNMVIKIVQAAKSESAKQIKERIFELEEDFTLIEQELDEYKRRVEVLEEIVSNDKQNLSGKIDGLSNKG